MSQTRPSRRRIVGEYAAVRMGGRALRDARGVDRARSPRGVRIAPNPQHGRTRARTGDAAPFTTPTRGRRGEARCRRRDLFQLLVRGRRRESSAAEERPVIPPEQMALAMRQARHPLADGNCREHLTDQLCRALTTRRPLQIGRSRASCRKTPPAAPRALGAENARSRGRRRVARARPAARMRRCAAAQVLAI